VRRSDAELLAEVDRALEELERTGVLADMRRRWFKADAGPYEEPELAQPAAGAPLKVGVSATREPFSFVDRGGRISGHDGELARRLGLALGRPVEFANMKFMALIPALQSGKVDLIVTGMTATDERRRLVAFSRPYYRNAQVMLVRKAQGAGDDLLWQVEDLRTRRIGVLMGSAHESWVLRNMPEAAMLQYKTVSDVTLALKGSKIDAALYDAEPLRELMREDDRLGRLGESLFAFDVGVGFAPDNDGLRERFDAFLAEIRAAGVYDDAVRRWINDRDLRLPAIAGRRDGGVLTVGVSDVGLPFVAMHDNRLVGLDVELADRFAASVGKELRLANMDFGSLIAAVASGKVDLIISSIYVTPERERQIDFSQPYFAMETHVAALKSRLGAEQSSANRAEERRSYWRRLADGVHGNLVKENRYRLILDGLQTTVLIALASTAVGTVLGAVICYLRMSPRKALQTPARCYIAILRGTPVLVLLMLVFYVAFASVDVHPVVAAVIAFAMNFAAYAAEIFRAGIEGIDKGQTEAGWAMGFTRGATFRYIVLPQMTRRILPVYKGEVVSLLKMTSVVGYIAVQDLTKASDIIRSRTFDAFFPLVLVAILYFLIAWLLIMALDYCEWRLDPKARRGAAVRS
jgi:polar amino acid transport system substrate-binding protein